MHSWITTSLWKQLASLSCLEARAAQSLLILEMPKIELILFSAHTSPLDFTLHDSQHSFRVAQWMTEIIPEEVLCQLSPYELTLLLLAAYLHDIGMTPEQGMVERLWYHLAYGLPSPSNNRLPLEEREVLDFQAWLDDEGRELHFPLAVNGNLSEKDKCLADLLIAHYCRHKHNDWSAEWIKTHLHQDALPGYETWRTDLVQLCHSHHEGYDDLKQERFTPRPAGPGGRPIHHRYLACLLRLADVLEIDPERTPEAVFRHRTIHPGSVLYWRKDHENWIIRNPNNLMLTAYPESALVENAIRKTADGIQQELQTCARLNREHPFFYWPLRPSQPLPHRWDIPEVLTVHIRPQNDTYVYIDGAFRPNTERLLELLSGPQLYQGPIVAVRELIQNAFDAVREEMAYQRLERPNDSELPLSLTQLHRVELSLRQRDGRWWLYCRDTGVGMTRRIIEEHLLISGSRHRPEVLELRRRCKQAGFRLGRTGQFGIGVLSYFMLADRIEIRTRRSLTRADAEMTGWLFSTEGVGSFGELRKDTAAPPGSEVGLRLKDKVFKNLATFGTELKKYVQGTVAHIPCRFQLHLPDTNEPPLSWNAGWIRRAEDISELLAQEAEQNKMDNSPLVLASRRKELENDRKFREEWNSSIRDSLHWKIEEGELPHGLGIYRILVPFFELTGGRCGAFSLIGPEKKWKAVSFASGKFMLAPCFELRGYILGMHVNQKLSTRNPFLLEINWESEEVGRLRVDRNSVKLSKLALNAINWAETRASNLLATLLKEGSSEYADLNASLLDGIKPSQRLHWVFREKRGEDLGDLVWGQVSFPIVLESDPKGGMVAGSHQGKMVTFLGAIDLVLRPDRTMKPPLLPHIVYRAPDKIVVSSSNYPLDFAMLRMWTSMPPDISTSTTVS